MIRHLDEPRQARIAQLDALFGVDEDEDLFADE